MSSNQDDLVTAFRDTNPQERATDTDWMTIRKAHGGQKGYHIHLHLLGGRTLGPMLRRPA